MRAAAGESAVRLFFLMSGAIPNNLATYTGRNNSKQERSGQRFPGACVPMSFRTGFNPSAENQSTGTGGFFFQKGRATYQINFFSVTLYSLSVSALLYNVGPNETLNLLDI